MKVLCTYVYFISKARLETTPLSLGKETGQVTINNSSSLRTEFCEVVQGKGCGHQYSGWLDLLSMSELEHIIYYLWLELE